MLPRASCGTIVQPNANKPQSNFSPVIVRPPVRVVRAPKWITGGPTDADNRHGRYRGSVTIRFTVGLDGRGSNCTTVSSSGNAQLDLLTCRLLVERGRFTVARDALGKPFSSPAYATYVWNRGSRSKK